MVPFKPFFMGEQTPPNRRLTSIQKSFRTTDIDEVGDHKHLTFFEMLGNFSIGDYFKNDAVAFAWELMTQAFGLEADQIFVTIHLDDDEAYAIWHDDIGIPPERIYRYGIPTTGGVRRGPRAQLDRVPSCITTGVRRRAATRWLNRMS